MAKLVSLRMTILLVVGIALVLASTTLNLGVSLSGLGILLIIFAGGALVWQAIRARKIV